MPQAVHSLANPEEIIAPVRKVSADLLLAKTGIDNLGGDNGTYIAVFYRHIGNSIFCLDTWLCGENPSARKPNDFQVGL
ncbi:MAG: hypothetical protein ACREVK_08825 [Gammaproteobacteria bacterium]